MYFERLCELRAAYANRDDDDRRPVMLIPAAIRMAEAMLDEIETTPVGAQDATD
jgi:hypothetical protein